MLTIQKMGRMALARWHRAALSEDEYDAQLLRVSKSLRRYRLNVFLLNRAALKIQHWFMRRIVRAQKRQSSSFSQKWLRQALEQNDVISEHNSWEDSGDEKADADFSQSSIAPCDDLLFHSVLTGRKAAAMLNQSTLETPQENDLLLLETSKKKYRSAQAHKRFKHLDHKGGRGKSLPKKRPVEVKRVSHPKGWGVRQSSWRSCDLGNLMTIMEQAWQKRVQSPEDQVKRELDYEAFRSKENVPPPRPLSVTDLEDESPMGEYFDKSRAVRAVNESRSSCCSSQIRKRRGEIDVSDIRSGGRVSPHRQVKSRSTTPGLPQQRETKKPWEKQVLEALTENPPDFFRTGIQPRMGARSSSQLMLRDESSSLSRGEHTFSQPKLPPRPKTPNISMALASPPQELCPVFNELSCVSFSNASTFDIKPGTPGERRSKTAQKAPMRKKQQQQGGKKYANVESKVKKMIKAQAPTQPKPYVRVAMPVSLDPPKPLFGRKGSTPNMRPRPVINVLQEPGKKGHRRCHSGKQSVPKLVLQAQNVSEEVSMRSTQRRGSMDTPGTTTGASETVGGTGTGGGVGGFSEGSHFLSEDGVITATVSTVSGASALDLSSELRRLDQQYEELSRSLEQTTSFTSEVSAASTAQKGVGSSRRSVFHQMKRGGWPKTLGHIQEEGGEASCSALDESTKNF